MAKRIYSIISHIKKYIIIYLIILFAVSARIALLSFYLEDWDSVQFALGIDNYSIALQQPHAPGYPVYVFMGKIVNTVVNNSATSLLLISAFLGSIIAIPFYFLAKKVTSQLIALIVTLILLVLPVEWTLSEVALSNIPGMFFLVTTAYFLYLGKDSNKYLYIGSFLAGLTLGVRFAEYSILLTLLPLVLIYRKGKGLKVSILLFIVGILFWLLPVLIDTGGQEFLSLYQKQASYIASHDSVLSQETSLKFRLLQLERLLNWGYTIYFLPIVLLIILYTLVSFKKLLEFRNMFFYVWLFSYLIPLVFIYNLEVTRHVLPLAPPLILLLALALYKFNNLMITSGSLVLLVLIATQGFEQVSKIHTLTPPSINPTIFVKKNFNPNDTTLITSFTYRQFEYYAPNFKNYYGSENVQGDIDTEIVITDYQGFINEISSLKKYNVIDTREFTGDPVIFPRLPKTTIYILKKNVSN